MRDINSRFGMNAGKIWSILDDKGVAEEKSILELSDLRPDDFHSGVGWLARENKISKNDSGCYKLGQTNLETEIGNNAGLVWKILDIWGDADFETIKRLSDFDENQVNSALGWLAREDKIYIDKKSRFNLK